MCMTLLLHVDTYWDSNECGKGFT